MGCVCAWMYVPTGAALVVIVLDICITVALTVCPVPDPCHCISDEIVYCAFHRLDELPYFLNFAQTWKELDLSENFLREIPTNSFERVRVRTITLTRNNIDTIGAQAFRSVGVRTLDLSHNYLETINPGALQHLKELRTLKLNYNRLTHLKRDAFKDITQLYELDLTGNDLKRVPWEALRPVTGLKRLILRHNSLQAVDKYAFYNLPLEYLDLGDNGQPLQIHKEAFCGLEPQKLHSEPGIIDFSGLHTLLLDHNGLDGVNPCIGRQIWTLATVDISGNPLRCDCNIWVLRDIGPQIQLPGAQCDSPDDFAGEFITDVSVRRYQCNSNVTLESCSSLCHSSPPSVNAASRVTTSATRFQSRASLIWTIAVLMITTVVT